MIKKIFISLLVVVGLGISFSDAREFYGSKFYEIGFDNKTSPVNNAFDISFSKGGAIISSMLGTSSRFLVLDTNLYAFWHTDGRFYVKAPKFQGFFNGYFVCDPILDGTSQPGNCSYVSNGNGTTFKSIYKGFFNKVLVGDYAFYKYGYNDSSSVTIDEFRICWSSEQVGNSLCFQYYRCENGHGCNQYNLGELVDSLNLTMNYDSVPSDIIGPAPGNVMYDDGSIDSSAVGGGTTPVIHCPTVQQLIYSYDNYSPNYSEDLCYTPGLIYSGGTVVSVTPTPMFDIFSSSDVSGFRNYYDLYKQNCGVPNSVEHCQSVFQGHELELSLISKIPDDIQPLHLYQYCRLQLLYPDKNTTTCVGSGITNGYTGRSVEDIVNDLGNGDYTIVAPDYTSIVNNVLTGTAGTEYTGDIFTSLQQIYGKFTSFFTTQTGNSNGILPTYIISMLLVIILFKLFKK